MTELVFPDITLNTLAQTAQNIIQSSNNHTLWCFEGEMGAGKTTLIKAICKELGVPDDITSPTFSLVNEYRTAEGSPLYHFDFYRIRSIEEVYDIGYEDYFYSGHICLIEWPSQIEELLADESVMTITLEKTTEDTRTIRVSST